MSKLLQNRRDLTSPSFKIAVSLLASDRIFSKQILKSYNFVYASGGRASRPPTLFPEELLSLKFSLF